MKTGWRGIGATAAIALGIGIAGLGVTACGLDVTGSVDDVPPDSSRDDPAENVVPVDLDQSGLSLESPELPDRPGR